MWFDFIMIWRMTMKHRNDRTPVLFTAVLAALASLAVCGCGSKGADGYYTLTGVNEEGKKVSEDDLSDYGLDDSYVVFDGDEGYLVIMDTPEDFEYDAGKGIISTQFGEVNVKVSGSKVTLEDSQFSMTFKKSKDDAPSKPETVAVSSDSDAASETEGSSESAGSGTLADDFDWADFDYENYDWANDPDGVLAMMTEDGDGAGDAGEEESMLAFWNGDWYGWYEIDAFADKYKKLEGVKASVMAKTTLEADGSGTIRLWDNEGDFANAVTSNNGSGLTKLGTTLSESGTCFDRPLEHADWNIDPGLYDHENYICIDARMYDDNDDLQFYYTIHLVKWGSSWDGFSEDELPNDYEWYKEQIEAGNPMPSTMPE